jgi:hypothetical protein
MNLGKQQTKKQTIQLVWNQSENKFNSLEIDLHNIANGKCLAYKLVNVSQLNYAVLLVNSYYQLISTFSSLANRSDFKGGVFKKEQNSNYYHKDILTIDVLEHNGNTQNIDLVLEYQEEIEGITVA